MKPILAIYSIVTASLIATVTQTRAESWPGWRGPRADGTSIDQNAPVNWDPANALWKTEIPGKGHASVIAYGDYIYTSTALTNTQDRVLLCLDRNTGKIKWQQTVVQGPLEKIHNENSYASSTPVTDGERIFAAFRVGDEIAVAAHDLVTGKQLWIVRPGGHVGEWGFNGQPVIYKDKIILDGDSKGESFLVALSRVDGKTLWAIKRTHKGISYSAPLIRELAGKPQLIQCGDRCVTSFDPETGKEIWTVKGPSDEFIASPVYSQASGLVYVSSAYPERTLLAIRPDGSGDVTATHVAWHDSKGAAHIPSMILSSNLLFTINGNGTAFCYEAANGNVLWQEKLSRHHASPVSLNGLLFFISDEGQINVIKAGAKFERVGQYELGEPCYASPAISDGQVFLRGFNHIICIGKRTKA